MSILASCDRERFEMEVAGPALRPETGEGATFVGDLAALQVPFHPIEMRRSISIGRDFAALVRLRALIRRRDYDVVHGHSSKAGFLARVAGWLTGRATVYTPNALYFLSQEAGRRRSLYVSLERMARPFTSRFVAVSESEAKVALAEKLVGPDRVIVIPNGIEPEAFTPRAETKERIRAELGIPLDAAVIGCAARLTAQKDPECLVRVVRDVMRRAKRQVYLVWVGDGELAGNVARLVRACGIDRHCRLLGYRRDVHDVLCAFDVFALTSRYEGLPYALLEAMALRLPVVATDVVGTRDVVTNGVNGFLAPLGDEVALATALLRLVDDAALRAKLGDHGRQLVAEQFTLADMARRLEMLYADVADRRAEMRVPAESLSREASSV
jgi:glycosyltransferase involved in cell wall biosynthesis